MLVYGINAKPLCGLQGLPWTGADPFFTMTSAMLLPAYAPDTRLLTIPDHAM